MLASLRAHLYYGKNYQYRANIHGNATHVTFPLGKAGRFFSRGLSRQRTRLAGVPGNFESVLCTYSLWCVARSINKIFVQVECSCFDMPATLFFFSFFKGHGEACPYAHSMRRRGCASGSTLKVTEKYSLAAESRFLK